MSINPRAIALQGVGFSPRLLAMQGLHPSRRALLRGTSGGQGRIGRRDETDQAAILLALLMVARAGSVAQLSA